MQFITEERQRHEATLQCNSGLREHAQQAHQQARDAQRQEEQAKKDPEELQQGWESCKALLLATQKKLEDLEALNAQCSAEPAPALQVMQGSLTKLKTTASTLLRVQSLPAMAHQCAEILCVHAGRGKLLTSNGQGLRWQ